MMNVIRGAIILFVSLYLCACHRGVISYRVHHPILNSEHAEIYSTNYVGYIDYNRGPNREYVDIKKLHTKGLLTKTHKKYKDDYDTIIKPGQKVDIVGYKFSSVIPLWIDCFYMVRVGDSEYDMTSPGDWLSIKIGDKIISGKEDFKKYKIWRCDQRPHIYAYYWLLGDLFYDDDVFKDVIPE